MFGKLNINPWSLSIEDHLSFAGQHNSTVPLLVQVTTVVFPSIPHECFPGIIEIQPAQKRLADLVSDQPLHFQRVFADFLEWNGQILVLFLHRH